MKDPELARVATGAYRKEGESTLVHTIPADPATQTQVSATSFLTATTLAYATGAGITAAAGTRLALQLLLV